MKVVYIMFLLKIVKNSIMTYKSNVDFMQNYICNIQRIKLYVLLYFKN